MIEARGVAANLGGATILSDVSVTFPEGRMTALVGPNGAGKSTLLGVLGRLIPAATGEVRLGGVALSGYSDRALALKLSVLRQDAQMMPRLTVRDLVTFGRYPHSRGRPGPDDKAKVEEAMARLGLLDLADRFLDTLSGGQRQRARIAMTLAQEAEVMLLDEPLAALDINHARVVMEVAREEATRGRTVIVVLHDLSVAAAHADHAVALKDGRVHSAGAAEDVLSARGLSDLYETQVSVVEVEGQRIVLPA
ncbi:ATP-binding cassette domain-containing protein [Maritimibacter sp. DP1N21-5]|uniref:ATP-binding cassette domain-containing protein n=1 Tax=Maritimibacter sp. DP1N21-5 TaxID=2836867 RepID=UPI001C481C43|nr:ATP-binding cassette domain-containing protein [Maritimibacter sp. DP1N21-5]MBV7407824.1 ATP-binding cassette domain-containing protein [Maritimibacter sp. DP1N21-5]